MVVKEGKATSYVNGVAELVGEIPYRPINSGITSVGVRQNQVCWFKGDLYRIRMDSGYPVQHIRTQLHSLAQDRIADHPLRGRAQGICGNARHSAAQDGMAVWPYCG